MTLRLCLLSLAGLSVLLLLRRKRESVAPDKWRFCLDADGRWLWRRETSNSIAVSRLRFETDIEAVADALAHGFQLSVSTMLPIVGPITRSNEALATRGDAGSSGVEVHPRRLVAHRTVRRTPRSSRYVRPSVSGHTGLWRARHR